MTPLHKVRIVCPDGRGVLTTVELDGEPLKGVTLVSFSADVDHNVQVTLRMYADLIMEGEAQIVQTWRQGLPWWRRLPMWMHR